MNPKSQINQTVIANALVAIFERLNALEKATSFLASEHTADHEKTTSISTLSADQAVLLERLEKLTLKRHAVLTATLGGQGYQAIAKAMGCDVTTVKLHLKAALTTLKLASRSALLAKSSQMLDGISDSDYQRRFAISKRWWTEDNAALMAVLSASKPVNNQHARTSKN